MHMCTSPTKSERNSTPKQSGVGSLDIALQQKGYRLFDPETQNIFISQDVHFVENVFGCSRHEDYDDIETMFIPPDPEPVGATDVQQPLDIGQDNTVNHHDGDKQQNRRERQPRQPEPGQILNEWWNVIELDGEQPMKTWTSRL